MRRAGIALVVVVVVVFADARLRRSEPNPEASASGALKAVAEAQSLYAAANDGYAKDLTTLARPCAGSTRPLLGPDLASDPAFKAGYEISLRPKPAAPPVSSDCNGAVTYGGYYAAATPLPAAGGRWPAFAVDETRTIWRDTSGVPPVPPFKETRTAAPLR
jgi:hypothetical protein